MSLKLNSKRGKRGAKNRQNNSMISHPPQLSNIQLTHSVTMRFIANAAVSLSVTFQNLLDLFLFAQTAVLGNDVFRTVKIRKVEAWASPLLGTSTSIAIQYNGTNPGLIGDAIIHEDVSMGIQPAHVAARPARSSLANDYQLSTAAPAFRLDGPSGMVVDVDLTFKGVFAGAVAAQNALVGANPGATYLRGLDGLAAAGTALPPSYPTVDVI